MLKKGLLLILLCCSLGWIQAQEERDRALAYQYYRNGDFDKAVELFEKLYNQTPSTEYYKQLFSTYKELKDFSAMEKLAIKQSRRERSVSTYLIDLGQVYKLQNKAKKTTEIYDDIIKNLLPDETFLLQTARDFEGYKEIDYAIETYLKGNKLLRDPMFFTFDISDLYFRQGRNAEAVSGLLDYIKAYPGEYNRIYAYLQSEQNKPEVFSELENQLYTRIQKNPGEDIYSETLIWMKVQQQDFAGAFIHAKALDKRKNEEGDRIMNLAQQAIDVEDYDNSIKMLEYIISKGSSRSMYIPARMLLLSVRKNKLTKGYAYTGAEVNTLKLEYLQFLNEFGKGPATATTIMDMARLEALYMHQLDSAILHCNEVVQMLGVPRDIRNKAKLELGDYYVMNNEYWESTLLYSQVDKEDKDGILGEEARFKNAKLSYYKGEFEWAQAQLDVLKGSTSELIANDALQLSVFIIDNTGLDTIYTAMEMFAKADLLIFQNQFDAAIQIMDSIPRLFSGHSLTDDIWMAKARIAYKKMNYDEAITWLNYIVKSDTYMRDILGDDACMMLAGIYERNKKDIAAAMELYKRILLNYKDSVYSTEARKKFRSLRGDTYQEEN